MKNKQVVENWKHGKQGKSKHMETDGRSLYSYRMKIGETLTNGKKNGLNVQSPFFYSQTTSTHVGIVRRYADKMINPKIIRNGWYTWYVFP